MTDLSKHVTGDNNEQKSGASKDNNQELRQILDKSGRKVAHTPYVQPADQEVEVPPLWMPTVGICHYIRMFFPAEARDGSQNRPLHSESSWLGKKMVFHRCVKSLLSCACCPRRANPHARAWLRFGGTLSSQTLWLL